MILWIVRIVVVMVLLGVAAAIATPPGRLPLALRGLQQILHKDGMAGSRVSRDRRDSSVRPVSAKRRLLAFALVVLAALVCLV